MSDTDDIAGDDKVMMMTLHSAKGLEFPTVFIVGWEEGVFPTSRALLDPTQLEEERRLAYVVSRGERRLYLTHAWSRGLHGSRQYNPPSRFLSEIPDELVHKEGSVDTERFPSLSRDDDTITHVAPRLDRRATSSAVQQPVNHGFRVGSDVVHPTSVKA